MSTTTTATHTPPQAKRPTNARGGKKPSAVPASAQGACTSNDVVAPALSIGSSPDSSIQPPAAAAASSAQAGKPREKKQPPKQQGKPQPVPPAGSSEVADAASSSDEQPQQGGGKGRRKRGCRGKKGKNAAAQVVAEEPVPNPSAAASTSSAEQSAASETPASTPVSSVQWADEPVQPPSPKSQEAPAGSSTAAPKAASSSDGQPQQGPKGRGKGKPSAAAQAVAAAAPKPIDSSAKQSSAQAAGASSAAQKREHKPAGGASAASQKSPSKGPAKGRQVGAASAAAAGVPRECDGVRVREVNPVNHEIAARLLFASHTCSCVLGDEDAIREQCQEAVTKSWTQNSDGYRAFFNALAPGQCDDFIVKLAEIFGAETGLSATAANVYLRESLLPLVSNWKGENFGETFCFEFNNALSYMYRFKKGKDLNVSFGENIITSFGYALVNTAFTRGTSKDLDMAPHLFDILQATRVSLPVRIESKDFDAVELVPDQLDGSRALLFNVERAESQMTRIKMNIYNRIANQVCRTICRPLGRLNDEFYRLTHAFEQDALGRSTCETKLFDGGKATVCSKINESIGFTRGRMDVVPAACRLVDHLAYVGRDDSGEWVPTSSSDADSSGTRILVGLQSRVAGIPDVEIKLASCLMSAKIRQRNAEIERKAALEAAQAEATERARAQQAREEADRERAAALKRAEDAANDAVQARATAAGSQMGLYTAYQEVGKMQHALNEQNDYVAYLEAELARHRRR